MRILRHEAGHAIDNAYTLRRRRRRQALFGVLVDRYPEYYTPKPYSKSFVLHLDSLVRAEPSRRGLRRDLRGLADSAIATGGARYHGWPALKKLEYMDELMQRARRRSRRWSSNARTRRSAAAPAARRCGSTTSGSASTTALDYPDFYDRDLRRLFSDAPRVRAARRRPRASSTRIRKEVRAHGGQLDRQLPVHDRPGARGHDRALPRAEPAPRPAPRSDQGSSSSCC